MAPKPEVTTVDGHDLPGTFKSAFEDESYSDLTIVCGDRTWKVHRVIVFKRCTALERLNSSSQKGQSSKQNRIVLSQYEPDAVEYVLRHLYGPLVYAVASDLRIADLKEFAHRCVKAVWEWKSAVESWTLQEFTGIVEELYIVQTNATELRDLFVSSIAQHYIKVSKSIDLVVVGEKYSRFWHDLLTAVHDLMTANPAQSSPSGPSTAADQMTAVKPAGSQGGKKKKKQYQRLIL